MLQKAHSSAHSYQLLDEDDETSESDETCNENTYRTETMARNQSTWHKPWSQISAKQIFAVICLLSTLSLTYIQLSTKRQNRRMELLIKEVIQNVGRDLRFTNVYKNELPKDFKYILLWTRKDFEPFSYLSNGQRTFLTHNCPINNCYVTDNRSLLGDVAKFDAVAFNLRNLRYVQLPDRRSLRQKYIFVGTESADNYPLCDTRFDDFFNWTYTYRVDSDIQFPYLIIKDEYGTIVGPNANIDWKHPENNGEFNDMTGNKTKAAAWFVSNCKTRSQRGQYVNNLIKALKDYGLTIDIYGKCGTHRCQFQSSECDEILRKDYFFYLAMENSFSKDYVSEKLLTAMNNDIVPIVYGGASYSRFLPPGSYLNARYIMESKLASMMNRLIHSPKAYSRYFWWKKHYTYEKPTQAACNLCEALNNKEKMEVSMYPHFRKWWNDHGILRCTS